MYYENIIYKSVAIQDQISNVVAFEIIENIMIDKTKNYYKFGNERDTLSRAIGENYKKVLLQIMVLGLIQVWIFLRV